jgi:hypothetical protein
MTQADGAFREAMMPDITHTFISYAHQDSIIANELQKQLTFLAEKGRGKPFLSCFLDTKSIPKGQKFEPIIKAGLENADWLIVIFTGDQSVYCGYEIGLYSVINPSDDKPIVCLHDVDKAGLPAVLDGYNTAMITPVAPYAANGAIPSGSEVNLWWDSPVGQFLREFCRTRDLYTPEHCDNPSEYTVDIARAARNISYAFELARQEDEKEETPVQAGFEITINPPLDGDLTRIPENSVMVGTSRAFDILGLNLPLSLSANQAPHISWGQLRKALTQPDRANIPWMDKLEVDIALAAASKAPRADDVTFRGRRDNRIYRAILTRHKLFMNGKRRFFVLLVETFDRRFVGDPQTSLLLVALTLASRWRFTFFERWHETLRQFDDSLSDEAFQDSCRQLEYNMEWMEHEGIELGADDMDAMVEAFGFANKARVQRFYTDWDRVKKELKSRLPQNFEDLKSDVRTRARDAIINFLTTIKKQNAEFLKLCIDKYNERICSSQD